MYLYSVIGFVSDQNKAYAHTNDCYAIMIMMCDWEDAILSGCICSALSLHRSSLSYQMRYISYVCVLINMCGEMRREREIMCLLVSCEYIRSGFLQ